jgi:hypothetical protein
MKAAASTPNSVRPRSERTRRASMTACITARLAATDRLSKGVSRATTAAPRRGCEGIARWGRRLNGLRTAGHGTSNRPDLAAPHTMAVNDAPSAAPIGLGRCSGAHHGSGSTEDETGFEILRFGPLRSRANDEAQCRTDCHPRFQDHRPRPSITSLLSPGFPLPVNNTLTTEGRMTQGRVSSADTGTTSATLLCAPSHHRSKRLKRPPFQCSLPYQTRAGSTGRWIKGGSP